MLDIIEEQQLIHFRLSGQFVIQHNKKHSRNDREHLFESSLPMSDNSPEKIIGPTKAIATAVTTSLPTVAIRSGNCKSYGGEVKDSDTEIGVEDGCASCYSSSMRDLLCDDLPEDCTFNGSDEIQVYQFVEC